MKIAAFLCFVSVACAANGPYFINKKSTNEHAQFVRQCSLPVFVAYHSTIPEELRPRVVNAINYWNNATDLELLFDIGLVDWMAPQESTGAFILVALGRSEDMNKQNLCGSARFFWNIDDGCIKKSYIMVNSDCLDKGPDVFETIVRHELGHVLGLRHTENFTDLMYFGIESTMQHPVDASLQEVNNVTNLYTNNGVCGDTEH